MALPALPQPEVFHKDGRRLFIIDGEPRVVDVDLSDQLGRQGERQIRSLIKRHAARLEKRGKLLVFQEKGELRYGSAVQDDILPLLRKEGLFAATGAKPTIAFLNKRQMRSIVARSETDAADDLLEELLDSIVATLRDHGAGHLQVVAGTIVDPVGPDGVSRQYAAGRAGGPKVLPMPPVPFLRGEDRRLRIRFSLHGAQRPPPYFDCLAAPCGAASSCGEGAGVGPLRAGPFCLGAFADGLSQPLPQAAV